MALIDDLLTPLFGDGGKSEQERALLQLEKTLEAADKINTPNLSPIDMERYQYLEDFTPTSKVFAPKLSAGADVDYQSIDPRLAETATIQDSKLSDISTDPRLLEQQMNALAELEGIVEAGGLTLTDKANLNRIMNDVAAQDRGRREAINQNMQMRGMSGSGLDLLEQLSSSQAATTNANQRGLDVAAMAQDRALSALMNQGSLAGDIRQQQFGEQATIAQAQDAINKFNTSNLNRANLTNAATINANNQFNAGNQLRTDIYNRDVRNDTNRQNVQNTIDSQRYNSDWANRAGQSNWEARQNHRNANTDMRNDEQRYNTQVIPQQKFDNELRKVGIQSNANSTMADYWQSEADREAKKRAQYIDAAIKGGSAAASSGGKS